MGKKFIQYLSDKINHVLNHPQETLIVLIFIILATRYTVTYLISDTRLVIPDSYYQASVRANDWKMTVMDQARSILSGNHPDPGMGYGYSFTIITALILKIAGWMRVCDTGNLLKCDMPGYRILVAVSMLGHITLVYRMSKDYFIRTLSLMLLVGLLLGIPGSRGIETGNLDIILSAILGFLMIYLRGNFLSGRPGLRSFMAGLVIAFLFNSKLFLVAFLPMVIFSVPSVSYAVVGIISAHLLIAWIPSLWGLPFDPVFGLTVSAVALAPITNSLYLTYPHGNNTALGYASGLIQAYGGHFTPAVRSFLVRFGAVLIYIFIFAVPVFLRRRSITALLRRFRYRIHPYGFINAVSAAANIFRANAGPVNMMLFGAMGVAAINIVPVMSYDYRLFYVLPVIYLMFDLSAGFKPGQRRMPVLSACFLGIRCMWILKGRIMNVFFYAHFFTLIYAALDIWLVKAYKSQPVVRFRDRESSSS